MSIIGLLLLIAFVILLAMAIFDAVWGTILVLNGLVWHTIGFILHTLAFVLRVAERIFGFGKKPKKQISVVRGLKRAYGV